MTQTEKAVPLGEDFSIDPFGADPTIASLIPGLGGAQPSPERGYVFRTVPVGLASGTASFSITFSDLAVGRGIVSIELTGVGLHPQAASIRLQTIVAPLREIMERGGALQLTFEAQRDVRYGLAGFITDPTDLSASGIEIFLNREGRGLQDAEEAHGVAGVALPRLVNISPPAFGDPVSQLATAQQYRHAGFRRWIHDLALADAGRDEDHWLEAFPAQVLERYGALRAGVRGLAFNVRGQALPAYLIAQGCSVHAIELSPEVDAVPPANQDPLEAYQRPQLCPSDAFRQGFSSSVAALHEQPSTERFDFAWSVRKGAGFSAVADALWFAVHRLRPGGLAVHLFDYNSGPNSGAPGLLRHEIERLALNVVSFGNEVAELRFRSPPAHRQPANATSNFGLVLRRS